MRKVRLVIIDSVFFEYANAFEQALRHLDVDAEIIRIPFFMIKDMTSERLKNIKSALKEKPEGCLSIFCPGTAEIFLTTADKLLGFSAYRHWNNSKTITVMPHVWTTLRSPETVEHLKWSAKPPLRIGFMGSAYANSRLAILISKFPNWIKRWLLHGSYLKWISVLAHMYQRGISLRYLNTFARVETLQALHTKHPINDEVELEIVDTNGFSGSEQEIRRYITHLEKMTYVICPRGIENFSIRVYEALKYGRVPVIIDTDMVLPKEVDWDRVSLRVPYESLDQIYDIILRDYNSRSAQDFVTRQEAAFSVMAELESMRWLKDLLMETISPTEALS